MKLNALGTALVYSTYLGGSGYDFGNGIAIDASGNANVVGDTASANFPTQDPIQSTNLGSSDVFIVKISEDSTPPTIQITAPTHDAVYLTNLTTINLAGTASDNVGVTQVTWSNDRGEAGQPLEQQVGQSQGLPYNRGQMSLQ